MAASSSEPSSSEASSSSASSEMPAAESSSSEAPAMSASSEEPAMAAAKPVIPSSDLLDNDTRIAILGDAAEGFGYVGVWAVDAATCGTVDQAGATNFAVITRSTFRDGDKTYFGNFGPLADGKLSITVRAASGTRTIAVEQTAADTLSVDGKAMIRCTQ
jgi:hypothetical protein